MSLVESLEKSRETGLFEMMVGCECRRDGVRIHENKTGTVHEAPTLICVRPEQVPRQNILRGVNMYGLHPRGQTDRLDNLD